MTKLGKRNLFLKIYRFSIYQFSLRILQLTKTFDKPPFYWEPAIEYKVLNFLEYFYTCSFLLYKTFQQWKDVYRISMVKRFKWRKSYRMYFAIENNYCSLKTYTWNFTTWVSIGFRLIQLLCTKQLDVWTITFLFL